MVTYHFESKLDNEWYTCTFVQPQTSFKGPTIQLERGWAWFLPLGQNIFSRSARTIFFSFYTRRDKICLPNLAWSYIVKQLPQRYILQKKTYSSQVTGLYITGAKLYYKGQQLATYPKDDVLKNCIQWLPNHALLTAHNCKSFDSMIIVSHIEGSNMMEDFKVEVSGFSDTLQLFKQLYPKRQT
jgi:hypothetical protein